MRSSVLRSKLAPAFAVVAFVLPLLPLLPSVEGCNDGHLVPTSLTREELLDPAACGKCHADHYREWSGSMHAYAADDPVFIAMNQRVQRETNGQIGDLCVRCHAPMAVRDGKTKDGLNLAELPPSYRGVTCFFCHTTEKVEELHNNGLVSGEPTLMRGPFDDAVATPAHRSTHSSLHDGRQLDSSTMCGSCHDIVTPAGAHIERTFSEWKASLFATESGQTCGSCHMKPSPGLQPIANVPGVFARTAHAHTFAAVDRALTPWPNMDEQTAEVQAFLDASLQASVCVNRNEAAAQIRVVLDNVFAGHAFPSGATADRRVWVELVATKAGRVVFESGTFDDDTPVIERSERSERSEGQGASGDPNLWLMRDILFDRSGTETHQFGLAACYESRVLPFALTANTLDPRYYQRNIVRDFPIDGSYVEAPDSVTMRVRIMPIGLEVLDELIASGDLDRSVRAQMRSMQVGPTVTWTPDTATVFVDRKDGMPLECVTATNQDFRTDKYPPPRTNTCETPK